MIELARQLARSYEFDENQAAAIFEWIIRTTISVEVSYLQMRIAASRDEN